MRALLGLCAAALFACSSEPSLPPLLLSGPDQGGSACVLGNRCPADRFCLAGSGAGCAYLECAEAGTWACVPDGGLHLDGAASPLDAGVQ